MRLPSYSTSLSPAPAHSTETLNPPAVPPQQWQLPLLNLPQFSCTPDLLLLPETSRGTFIRALNQDAEESFKKTLVVDMLIDALKVADEKELQNLVVENILAFNASFWLRLAARSDISTSEDDKKDYAELASSVMRIVDCVVNKTNEKIELSTDVLKEILRPVVEVEEVAWPPRDPEALNHMEEEVNQREQEGKLDEGFLSEVSAQLRQAKEGGDKPGLEAMLQKVLQLYPSRILSRHSYARKGNGVVKDEQLREEIINELHYHYHTKAYIKREGFFMD